MGSELTAQRLKELLIYDAETGYFWWREAEYPRRVSGLAGWTGPPPTSYVRIGIDGVVYHAHRLAWLYVHGRWPTNHIDHINRNPSDNRIENLREATRSQNHGNRKRRSDNSSGYKGVGRHSAHQWRAQIQVAGRRMHLGLYPSAEEAHEAYMRAAQTHFGEFARSDKS